MPDDRTSPVLDGSNTDLRVITAAVHTQSSALQLPFPPAMHRNYGRVETLSKRWLNRFQLKLDSLSIRRLARLSGRCQPIGSIAALSLATDFRLWLAIHDRTLVSSPPAAMGDTHRRLLEQLQNRGRRVTARDNLSAALLDLLTRGESLAGEAWSQRFVAALGQYFRGCQWQAEQLSAGESPSITAYLVARRDWGSTWTHLCCGELAVGAPNLSLDMAERPDAAQQLATLTGQIITGLHDLYSLPRRSQQPGPNLVRLFRLQHGLSWADAARHCALWVNQQVAEFIATENQLDNLTTGINTG